MTLKKLREWAWAIDDLSLRHRWFTWITHGVLAIPLSGVAYLFPWSAPGLVFLYREAGQLWFKYLAEDKIDWLDHIIDWLVPSAVGWWLLA